MSTVKLDGWQPNAKPPEDECSALRDLIIQAVFGAYHEKKQLLAEQEKPSQPVSLDEIYLRVQVKVDQLMRVGKWRFMFPSKRTVDRRVNEASSLAFNENGVPKIVAVTAGFYTVNPALFVEEKQKTRNEQT